MEKAATGHERAKDMAQADLHDSQDAHGHSHVSPNLPAKAARKENMEKMVKEVEKASIKDTANTLMASASIAGNGDTRKRIADEE